MFSDEGHDAFGRPFDSAVIEAVWEKTVPSPEHAPLHVDRYGSLIWRQGYGNTMSKLGWEIRHITPVASGGGDELENLEAIQWEHLRRNGFAMEI